jgi:hypothetical protein
MFILTLTLTDSDDAGYFTNKAMNKLHGFIQHHSVKFAIFFTFESIKIYSSEKSELEDLMKNKAISFDIKRHIFDAEINEAIEPHIKVFKRVRDTVYDVRKKVNERLFYYKDTLSFNEGKLLEDKKNILKYYEEKQQHQTHRRYFIIKNKEKRFTLWLEVRQIKVADFSTTAFNSYGLLRND